MKYIDSSAFVKYYSDENVEKGANKVKTIIDKAKNGKETLISSVMLIGEVISAFDKWTRLKLLTKEQTAEIISEFVNDVKGLTDADAIIIEDVNSIIMIPSIDYIVKYHLTVNDSLHLYSALLHKGEVEEFISSDNRLNAAARREGLRIFNPEE